MTMSNAELRARWNALSSDVNRLAREAALLRRAVKQLGSNEGYESLKQVQKMLAHATVVPVIPGDLEERVKEATGQTQTWLDKEWEQRDLIFAEELCQFFADREITLEGQAPRFSAHPLQIEFNSQTDQARILYCGEVMKDRIPLAPDRIFREWQAAIQTLQRDSTPPDRLFEVIQVAMDRVCALKGIPAGGRVRLPDLLFQLFADRQTAQVRQNPTKARLKDYPRYQFAYDLSKMLADPDSLKRNGKQLTVFLAARAAAEGRSTSIVLEDGRGGYAFYGDIRIEAVKPGVND